MDDELRPSGEAATSGVVGNALEGKPATFEDEQWLVERARRQPGRRVLVRMDGEQDVSGHMAADDPTLVRVLVHDEEMDTVGHAISIRLPSVEEADAFRRRLLLTGVLVGTVVLGGAGAALALTQAADEPATHTADQIEDVSYEDATPNDAVV